MQRIMQLDNEIMRCLNILNDVVPFATTSGNINMTYAADMVIRGLVQYHNEKMVIMQEFNRENENPLQTPVPPPLSEYPSFAIRQPIQFAEMDYSDDDEEEGPMQLADLMENSDPISQVVTPEHVQYTPEGTTWGQFVDGGWANLEQDWTDTQPENLPSEEDDTPIHQNITVRPTIRQVSRVQCVRKMVYNIDSQQLREPSENECNVCFEKQMLIDTCVTSCRHHFCKGCFARWETTCGRVVTCPTCRTERPVVTEYRSRSVV
jgi:hypothetical protein